MDEFKLNLEPNDDGKYVYMVTIDEKIIVNVADSPGDALYKAMLEMNK